ncbi:MAG: hypothetical protein KAU14_00530, partial [Thermoplasmata archaeon]|nr:hypothetical protein [Thermoplasmata archaeon]
MDLAVAFESMFLLAFGLTGLGLGLFTAYFGAGKSRIIGVILALIGIVVLALFYLMTVDYFGYDWGTEDVTDSFLGLIGIILGGLVAIGLIVGLMMVIKEKEAELPGMEDWEKGLEEPKVEEEKPEEAPSEEVPGAAPAPEEEKELEEKEEEPVPEEVPEDEMEEYLRMKEEKTVVEDWEKVKEEEKEEAPEEPPAPEEEKEEAPEEPAPGETETEIISEVTTKREIVSMKHEYVTSEHAKRYHREHCPFAMNIPKAKRIIK